MHFIASAYLSRKNLLFKVYKKALKNIKSLSFFNSRNIDFGVPVRTWCLWNSKENLSLKPFKVDRQYWQILSSIKCLL